MRNAVTLGAATAMWLGATLAFAAETPTPTPSPKATATPSVSSEPQNTTATYGDWVLRCDRAAASGQTQRLCEVAQTLEAKGQGVVAQIAFSRMGKDLHLTIALPPNVSFPSVVRVSVNEKDPDPTELAWKRCLPGGCIADADIPSDVSRSWRAQTGAGQIRFALATGQAVTLAFSFRGLAVALEALAKTLPAQ